MHPHSKFNIFADLIGVVAIITVVFGTVFLIWLTTPRFFDLSGKEFSKAPSNVLGVQNTLPALKVIPVNESSNLVSDYSLTKDNDEYVLRLKFTMLFKGPYKLKIFKLQASKEYGIALSTTPELLPVKIQVLKNENQVLSFPNETEIFISKKYLSKEDDTYYLSIDAKNNVNYPFTVELRIFEK